MKQERHEQRATINNWATRDEKLSKTNGANGVDKFLKGRLNDKYPATMQTSEQGLYFDKGMTGKN